MRKVQINRTKISLRALFVVLIVNVFFLSGCSLFYDFAPKLDLSEYRPASNHEAQLINSHIAEEGKSIVGFRDLVNLNVKRDSFSVASELVVVFEQPDKLRMEFLLPGIQQSETIVRASNGFVDVFMQKEKVLIHGQDSVSEMFRLLGIPLNVSELMFWISGRLPLWNKGEIGLETVLLSSDFNDGVGTVVYKIVTHDGRVIVAGYKCKLGSNSENGVCYPSSSLSFVEVYKCSSSCSETDSNHRLFVSKFSEESISSSDVLIPKKISFWLPKQNISGEMNFTNPKIYKEKGKIQEKVFHPKFPQNITTRDAKTISGSAILLK